MKTVGAAGLGMIEVLVALGLLALVLVSLVSLQASSLEATRAARTTRDLAAAAEAEAKLRSLLVASGPGCLVATRWPAVSTCEVRTECLGPKCRVALHEVSVGSGTGKTLTVTGAALVEDPAIVGGDPP